MGRQKSAEGIVGLVDRTEGPNLKYGVGVSNFDDLGDAEGRSERSGAVWSGRGIPDEARRCIKGHGKEKSSRPETMQVMEAAVAFESA
jgi:hypothetical protein